VEERRRTKVIPGFLTEKSALKLVFSTLLRASRRWNRVTFTPLEIMFLDNLREDLGIKEEGIPSAKELVEEVVLSDKKDIHFYRKKRT